MDTTATRAAIIGVSGFGKTHYEDLMAGTEAGHTRPVAATIVNQNEEADKCERLRSLGCEIFEDYERMLAAHAGHIDLCYIPTGIHLHAPMTVAALEAGANVFVEKPLAATVQEARAIEEAAARAARFVAVGYQDMYAREMLPMKRLLAGGGLGRVLAVKFWALAPRGDVYYARNNWAGRLRAGNRWVLDSPVNNALAHQVNMIAFLAGREVEASAELSAVHAELYHARDIESADTTVLRAETRDGPALFACVTHCTATHRAQEVVARCEGGTLYWQRGETRIEHADGRTETIPSDSGKNRARIRESVRMRLRDPETFICTPRIASRQTLLVNGAHESSAVHPVPADRIRRQEYETRWERSTLTVIEDIDEILRRSFAEEKLLSELGVSWANPGERFALTGYENFRGGKTGA